MDTCENCPETQRLTFVTKGLELEIIALQRSVSDRDVEHDTVIRSIANRMFTMEECFTELKADVKKDIQSIKDEIPAMFETAVNKLMARILKWIVVGFLSFIGLCLLIVVVAFSRPYVAEGLKEIYERVQTMEVK